MTDVSFADDAVPAKIVADFESRSRRYETPCGDGAVVWRAWGSGPPVVLFHGSHGAWSHWVRNIDALAQDRTVWAADIPGYGESAMPPRPDHESIADVLSAGLRQLIGANLPVDVVGFSLGGLIGSYLAAYHPDVVRRLILVDTGGLGTPMGKIKLVRVRGLEGEDKRAALTTNLLELMINDPANVDELALYLQETNGFKGRLDAAPLVLPARLLDVLPRVTVQLDAIWANHDQPHPDAEVQAEVIRRTHPDLEMCVVPDTGHWVMYENAPAFNRTLREYLAEPLRSKDRRPT
jgi:pimeloyl-ACP methyl ester carboxylesterase